MSLSLNDINKKTKEKAAPKKTVKKKKGASKPAPTKVSTNRESVKPWKATPDSERLVQESKTDAEVQNSSDSFGAPQWLERAAYYYNEGHERVVRLRTTLKSLKSASNEIARVILKKN